MKTLLILIVFCLGTAFSVNAQTVRLQQKSASGAWTTVQSKTGNSGNFTNVANGTYRLCVVDQGTTSCIDKDAVGKPMTVPQSSPKQNSSTFMIANVSWTLIMKIEGTTVGWNWGKSATTGKNNAR